MLTGSLWYYADALEGQTENLDQFLVVSSAIVRDSGYWRASCKATERLFLNLDGTSAITYARAPNRPRDEIDFCQFPRSKKQAADPGRNIPFTLLSLD